MEMGGIHVKDVNNPSKNYPKAVFIGAAITVIIFVLGTFSLGIIIPAKDISLTQSLLVGFDNYFHYIRASWLSPIIAIALAFGAFGRCHNFSVISSCIESCLGKNLIQFIPDRKSVV